MTLSRILHRKIRERGKKNQLNIESVESDTCRRLKPHLAFSKMSMSAQPFELGSQSSGSKLRHGRRTGLGLTVLVALFATLETASTSFATTSAVSPYTVNVVQCFAGTATLWMVAMSRRQQLYVQQNVFLICIYYRLKKTKQYLKILNGLVVLALGHGFIYHSKEIDTK